MMRWGGFALGILMATFLWGANATDKLAPWKTLPTPLQSSDSALFVTCATPKHADLRWPVLSFANRARERIERRIRPIGHAQYPLSIILGSVEEPRTDFIRRQMRSGDYCHLILEIPNPATVDLDALEVGIAEALLRESVRGRTGKYSAFRWPAWFIRGILDMSRDAEWQAAAYEVLAQDEAAKQIPSVDALFAGVEPKREVGFFFARWVLSLYAYDASGRQALPEAEAWEAEHIIGDAGNRHWEAYVYQQRDTIFAPGILSLTQFQRWRRSALEPQSLADIRPLQEALLQLTLGRPKVLQELCTLYLHAYAVYNEEDKSAYLEARRAADEAADLLEQTLKQTGSVVEKNALPIGEKDESQ